MVAAACAAGVSVVPRGGGASYTDGYLPSEPDSILLDTLRLDRIVELNQQDMYVTVEAGVTWAKLNEALVPLGLRTPFYGPFSGLAATVGGSVSQHSVSWGTGVYRRVSGIRSRDRGGARRRSIVRTGTAGTRGASPFFRHYGPDLTGLFTGDAGALGVKTRITLRLMRRPQEFVGLSFKFADFDSMYAGMARRRVRGTELDQLRARPAAAAGPDRQNHRWRRPASRGRGVPQFAQRLRRRLARDPHGPRRAAVPRHELLRALRGRRRGPSVGARGGRRAARPARPGTARRPPPRCRTSCSQCPLRRSTTCSVRAASAGCRSTRCCRSRRYCHSAVTWRNSTNGTASACAQQRSNTVRCS